VTAAIANAVFDALGLRVRNLPITRERLIAAMDLAS
jgi:CO/xanthine dehydrogenase Mo-binding subunit